jgi:hypothetical protein
LIGHANGLEIVKAATGHVAIASLANDIDLGCRPNLNAQEPPPVMLIWPALQGPRGSREMAKQKEK